MEESDGVLQRFYCEIKCKNGENYEPDSLRVMQAALDHHLKNCGCKYSIMKDIEFQTSRKVLNGKAIELQQKYGRGK